MVEVGRVPGQHAGVIKGQAARLVVAAAPLQGRSHPFGGLAVVAVGGPVPTQRRHQTEVEVGGRRAPPLQGSPEVVRVLQVAVDPNRVVPALGEGEEMLGVEAAGVLRFARRCQPLQPIRADRVQLPVALVAAHPDRGQQ